MNDPKAPRPSPTRLRTDIQALRGIAVLLVVLYHSGLGLFDAGYLGVDMFFVVSGYLITGIIARGLRAGTFSFANFYTRRARRLMPAAYTVLAITSFASWELLTTSQYRLFLTNLIGSVLFSANFTLWSQTGYFHPDSAFDPLLHMWSLAIEEQYYLLLPITLFLLSRRSWLPMIAGATAISLAACFYLAATKPSIAFFWFPPRAWELGIGSLAALTWERVSVRRFARVLLWPAVLAILLIPIRPLPGPVPGFGAVLICLATGLIILARDERADGARPLRLMSTIGDFSYSLYLVHWPMFALTRAAQLSTELHPLVAIALVGASIGLALILYRFVERPLHHSRLSGIKLIAAGVAGSVAVLGLGYGLWLTKPAALHKTGQEAPVEGLNLPGCFSEDGTSFKGTCTQAAEPEVLLWGDSYSAHLVPGLQATSRHPFAQASKGHCTPLVGYAAVASGNEDAFAKGCLAYSDSVLDYVRRTKSLKVVILAGQYSRTLANEGVYALRRLPNGATIRSPLGLQPTIAAQRDTVARLRRLGVRVILVSPPPPSDFDLGKCWERMAEGLPRLGEHHDCRLGTENAARAAQSFEPMIRGFATYAGVPVVRLDRTLCHAGRCDIESDHKPIFRDTGHLTTWGSLVVGRRLHLGELAWREAR